MRTAILIEHLTKRFADEPRSHSPALDDINLDIRTGEILVIVGPSGCGKSSLLRIVSGLDETYRGRVRWNPNIRPEDVSFVFQDFALLPWLTVSQNIELGLEGREVPSEERRVRIRAILRALGLTDVREAYPHMLSGGMKQRVGIARAFVTKPKVIFMDEPFSELDSFTAASLRRELIDVWLDGRPTIIMVTHMVPEAIELADRIAVMTPRPGTIEQVVENTLPRPRFRRSAKFYRLEDELTALIRP
jgi:ABC-type nitrate/sulfonate/bicarbonate transport system ATPase subunit